MQLRVIGASLGVLFVAVACQPTTTTQSQARPDVEAVATDNPVVDAPVDSVAEPVEASVDAVSVEGTLAASREIPPGSWKQSCDNIKLTGVTLTASCRNRWGNVLPATLDLTECPIGHNVMNDNAKLVCRGL